MSKLRTREYSLEGFTVLPGSMPIRSGDELIGGLGFSGAPGGEIDENCAGAGLQTILPGPSSTNSSINIIIGKK